MGLAASQARLLTITSRLSSVELRQQRIAMDKIRLASDQQGVSDKYTKALSNKTLSFSDGTNTIPMSYTTLVSQGYSVARASDGLVPEKEAPLVPVEKPTCKRPSEITPPVNNSKSLDNIKANYSINKLQEADSWQARLANIKNSYGEYPAITKTASVEELFKNSKGVTLSAWNSSHLQSQANANKEFQTSNLWDLIKTTKDQDKLVRIGDDGDKKGVPVAQAQQNVQNIADAIIKSIASGLGLKDLTGLQKASQSFIDNLKNNINGYQDKNKHYSESKATNGAKNDARNAIIGNGTDKGGTDHDFYFLNVSELARRLMAVALNSIGGQNISVGTKCDSARVSLNTSTQYTMTYNSKGYSVAEWEKQAKNTFNSAGYKELTWNDALDVAKGVAQEELKTSDSSYVDPEQAKYEQEYANYQKEYQAAESAWNAYDTYIAKKEAKESGQPASAAEEFYNQLQNSQFLIQGLLSGYLTLMKDGKEVSLASATDILEDYDKSDDAAAEAEYNSQMNKINMKEKMLDMQAKRIDTEYSALTTEYESIKNIISQHTSKDFSYFT